MSGLAAFQLRRPVSWRGACAMLADLTQSRALAGGTDLLTNLRHGLTQPAYLVDLALIRGAAEIVRDDAGWRLGAGVSLQQMLAHAALCQAHPALQQAALGVAAPAHRSAATLGGNLCQDTRCVHYNQSAWWRQANDHCLKLGGTVCHVAPQGARCHAAYSGDLAPALIALDAHVCVVTVQAARVIALADLYIDDGAHSLNLAAGELISEVRIPVQPAGARSAYRKARVRGAIDFPLAGVAVSLARRAGGLSHLRLALTGVATQPLTLELDASWIGAGIDDAWLDLLATQVRRQVTPIRTTAVAAHYRREVAATLTRRLVRELWDAGDGADA